MTVRRDSSKRARHVVLVAHQLDGGDDAVLIVAHRLHERVDGLPSTLDVLADGHLVDAS